MRSYHQLTELWHHKQHQLQTLTLLYLAYTIRTAIFSFLSIFLPIYYFQTFIKLNYPTTLALALVFLIFVVFNLTHVLSAFIGGRLIHKYSLRKLMVASNLLLLLFCALLIFNNTLLIFILANLVLGINSGLWWEAYHLDFVLNGKKQQFGQEIGLRQGFGILTAVISPLFAGLIIKIAGYQSLYIFTTFLAVWLTVVAYALIDEQRFQAVSLKNIVQEIKKYPADFLANLAVGGENLVAEIFWPLILFLTFKQPLMIGFVTALIALIAFGTKLLAGKVSDLKNKGRIGYYGALSVGTTWLGKLLLPNMFMLVFLDVIYKITNSFFYIPVMTLCYLRSLFENRAVYITAREIVLNLGKTVVLLLATVLVLIGVPIYYLLLFGAVFPLLTYFLRKQTLPK